MRIIRKIELKLTFLFLSLMSFISFGQEEGGEAAAEGAEAAADAAVTVVQEQHIYEKMGMSSTMLFALMITTTVILLIGLAVMGSAFKSVVRKYGEDLNKGAKIIAFISFSLFSLDASAADPYVQEEFGVAFPDSLFWWWIAADLLIIGAIWFFWHHMKRFMPPEALPKPLMAWRKISKDLTDAVEIEDEASITLDHEYDGIRELDNNLPPWWKWGFYITIAWAFGYVLYYQVFEVGPLQDEEFRIAMEEGEREVAEYKAAHPELITPETAVLLEDAAAIASGKSIYDSKCATCHGEGGSGGLGPNLTDQYWLYNGDFKSVFTSVYDGRSNGMIPWKTQLSADKIQNVASYVMSLEYIAPPTGKEPQGDIWEE